jgi:hypothetical protein
MNNKTGLCINSIQINHDYKVFKIMQENLTQYNTYYYWISMGFNNINNNNKIYHYCKKSKIYSDESLILT